MTDEVSITATKLRRDLGAVLEAVLKGKTVHVSRQGRPYVVLVPPEQYAASIKPPTESSSS